MLLKSVALAASLMAVSAHGQLAQPSTPAQSQVAPVDAGQSTNTQAADALLGSMARNGPGAVVLVTRAGAAIYTRAYGAADLEQGTPITVGTRFHVASVSKQFTAMALVLLAQEGKIDLDADIRIYLPELPDFKTLITVADLLHHTSGLRDQFELWQASGNDMQSLLTHATILSLVRAQANLNFTPGSEYRYSNTGYSLAAEIVARVSGMPFRQFLHDRIFVPVGMNDSLIYDNAADIVAGRAQSYTASSTGHISHLRLNYSNYGATSLTTTAGDLQKWSQELLHPRVFDPALLKSLYQLHRLTDGTLSNYGLGLGRVNVNGQDAIMHTGSDAGYRSLFANYPSEDTSIIIISNGSADLRPLHEGLVDIFLNGAARAPAVTRRSAAELARLPGYYASTWGTKLELKAENGAIIRIDGAVAKPATFRPDNIIEFPAPLTRYRIVERAGKVVALEELQINGPPVRYSRTERGPVPAEALQGVPGRYRSAELDITYLVSMTKGQLTMANLRLPSPVPMTPISADWFDLPTGRINVVRDAQGRPTALLYTLSRSRNMRFDRVTTGE